MRQNHIPHSSVCSAKATFHHSPARERLDFSSRALRRGGLVLLLLGLICWLGMGVCLLLVSGRRLAIWAPRGDDWLMWTLRCFTEGVWEACWSRYRRSRLTRSRRLVLRRRRWGGSRVGGGKHGEVCASLLDYAIRLRLPVAGSLSAGVTAARLGVPWLRVVCYCCFCNRSVSCLNPTGLMSLLRGG